MTFYGENIHAQGVKDTTALLAHVRKAQPAWLLVMDGLTLAVQLKAASPTTNVIHRNYGVTNGDDDVFARVSPEQWLDLRAKESDTGVWLHTTCEPGWGQDVIDWHVNLMRRCIPRKTRLVVGNWSVGTPKPGVIAMARPMLELLDEHRDLFVLGLHEYANAVITSGFVGGAPNGKTESGMIVHPDYTLPGRWPLNGEAKPLTKWHMGRSQFWVEYCQSIGMKPPRIVLTETGFDDVSDIKWWTNTLPRTGEYRDIRGFKTLFNYWHNIMPDWSEDLAYFKQLEYAENHIFADSPVEGGCIYCYGHIDPQWQQDDIEGRDELLGYLEADTKTGDNTMLARHIEPGTLYRINLPGGITGVYKTPDINDRINGKTIPDQAEVRAFSPVYIKPETWLPIEYPTIEGRVWIPMKDGAVKLQTLEMPIVVNASDTPKTDEKPLSSDLAPLLKPDTKEVVETPVLAPSKGYVPTAAQVAILESWRAELSVTIAAANERLAIIDNLLASIKV